eukprot:TRINITY_DN9335_c0_g1_i1.p1 TRINITY_DN9335_c0_g1~~TRINITY_DN9335_c0_g1_i1.p1  ORF type:complete len:144 (+),score=18.06 TRINITY_DN9335_c0_g1_i1:10-441(+)
MFLILFGLRFFGWRDFFELPDGRKCCVATQFLHVLFLPLIPIRSVLVVGYTGSVCGSLRVRPVPLSLASIAIAWLRFFLLGALWCWEPRASEARKRELLLLATGRVAATASQADIENAVKESEKESLLGVPTSPRNNKHEEHV